MSVSCLELIRLGESTIYFYAGFLRLYVFLVGEVSDEQENKD